MASGTKPVYDECSVDLDVHANGHVRCSILPVAVAAGGAFRDAPTTSLGAALTVIVTTSPVRSNPSTRMVQESFASLDAYGGCAGCNKLILCDGVRLHAKSRPKVGVVTAAEAEQYGAYVARLGALCQTDSSSARTRIVRLGVRLGSAFAIREAPRRHVQTPAVLICRTTACSHGPCRWARWRVPWLARAARCATSRCWAQAR